MDKHTMIVWGVPASQPRLCGLPLAEHAPRAAQAHWGEVVQAGQEAEALALLCGLEADYALLLPADMPLLLPETARALLEALHRDGCAAALCGRAAVAFQVEALRALTARRAQGFAGVEEALDALSQSGQDLRELAPAQPDELLRVTNPASLAKAMQALRARSCAALMEAGVVLIDPQATYVDVAVQVGEGTVIYPGNVLEGATRIGARCTLLPNNRMLDALVDDDVTLEASVLLEAQVGAHTTVGPYAYLRPGTRIGAHCRVGDFVEIKNSVIGEHTKVSHLTYVGDSDLGKDINLGCGVVFVNYDGKKKHRTKVGDHAFIGCNVNLVSPVEVGHDAYVAAGSTVTADVPPEALCVARGRQVVKEGWVAARRETGKL